MKDLSDLVVHVVAVMVGAAIALLALAGLVALFK